MLIIAGSLRVDPADRDGYVESCTGVVEQARSAAGCLDFSISADPLDSGRINIFERWESDEDLMRFRGSGSSDEQNAQILDADVRRYLISAVEAA